jgi:hypothetical protein
LAIVLVALREQLNNMSKITDAEWMGSPDQRKCTEFEFHDGDRNRGTKAKLDQDMCEKFCGNKKYYLATQPSVDYMGPEQWRILASGEKKELLAVEALDSSLKDTDFAKRFFDIGEIQYWHIASILGPHMKMLLSLFSLLNDLLVEILSIESDRKQTPVVTIH